MRRLIQALLRWQSKLILWKYKPVVIAVTGSVGKSSAKEAIFAVVSKKFAVRKSPGNFNTEIGVPLAIIGARHWLAAFLKAKLAFLFPMSYPKILILEMAADRPGDLEYLTKFVKPAISVVTAVGPSHLEFFGSLQKIAAEKARLMEALAEPGTAILNWDNEDTRAMAEKNKGQTIFYGLTVGEDGVSAAQIQQTCEGVNFKVRYRGNTVPVRLPGSLGRPAVSAALAALSVGLALGMNLVEIAEALLQYQSLPGRLRLLRGVKQTQLIDDSYNAAPASVVAALETLAELPAGGRRIAVLGDMAELGQFTEDGHRQVGAAAAKHGIDFLVVVGPRAKFIADEARQKGYPAERILSFDSASAAQKSVEKLLQPGDLVLIKGSRMMRMEEIVLEVMAEPERAAELLVS